MLYGIFRRELGARKWTLSGKSVYECKEKAQSIMNQLSKEDVYEEYEYWLDEVRLIKEVTTMTIDNYKAEVEKFRKYVNEEAKRLKIERERLGVGDDKSLDSFDDLIEELETLTKN